LPNKLGEIFGGFRHILVPENNLGQLTGLLRSRFSVEFTPLPMLEGRPFRIQEIRNAIEEMLRK
jgi:2-oxoglutarate ferredoxin oxidoreductase subunit alpha